jgi:hypothetical protein
MSVCAWQFFDCCSCCCGSGWNGEVMDARDSGEFLAAAAADIGDLFGGRGRETCARGTGDVGPIDI